MSTTAWVPLGSTIDILTAEYLLTSNFFLEVPAGMLEPTQLAQQLPGDGRNSSPQDKDKVHLLDDEVQHSEARQVTQDREAGPVAGADHVSQAVLSSNATAMEATAAPAQDATNAAPAEAPKKLGKDKHKGSRLAQDVHEDTVRASAAVLQEVTGTLLTSGPAAFSKGSAFLVLQSASSWNFNFQIFGKYYK